MQKTIVFLFLCFASNSFGQVISGVIKDSRTKAPIAFVNLKIPNTRTGGSTDIDGKFSIKLPKNYDGKLIVSHVGYERLHISLGEIKAQKNDILLQPKTTSLIELIFKASENPAYNLIRQVVANRKLHDPNRLSSYQYKSYNKEIIRLDGNSERADSILLLLSHTDTLTLSKNDSITLKLDSMVKSQHFFINESVTEKKYRSPGLINEQLLASKTSGVKSPLLASTSTKYQPLGFYDEVIDILDNAHINPIAEGTLRRYEFYLEDTTFYQQDTVFVLNFYPREGKNFQSLKGQLSISKNGYAIRDVIATTSDSLSKTDVRIQQSYECIDGVWFPSQVNTNFTFKELDFLGRRMVVEAKSYFTDIQLNIELSKKDFDDVVFEVPRIGEDISLKILSENRVAKLDSLEVNTYEALDTLANKIERITNVFEYLITERIPISIVDLNIDKFIRFNQHEKVRLGIGGKTNDRFSKFVELGSYVGYGFGDEDWKYGGSIKFDIHPRTSSYLKFSYEQDLIELGRTSRFDNAKVLEKQLLRSIEGSKYSTYEMYKVSFHSRIAPFAYSEISLKQDQSTPTYSYDYVTAEGVQPNTYNFTEATIAIRYVKKENYLNFKGKKVLFGHEYPVITASFAHGVSGLLDGDFDYDQFGFTIDFEKKSRFGETSLYLVGEMITGEVPILKLITGSGNNTSNFLVPHYFQAMGLYEFVSDREASLFVTHNFGNILLNKKLSKPELILHHNMAIGELSNADRHQNIQFNTLEGGYFESGIGLKNIIRFNYVDVAYIGLGADVFYRYGAYSFTKTSDNFAFRLNFDFSF